GESEGPQLARGHRARRPRHRGAVARRLPAARHRGDACVGQRSPAPRGGGQAMNGMRLIDHLPALPEVVLLVGACALMIFDLYVKHEGRAASAAFAQVVLYLCAAATVFVIWGSGGNKYVLFNGLFVADLMAH